MRRGMILLLQVVVLFAGVAALAGLLSMPQIEGRNANADQATIYFRDPFLIYAYVGSLPFFFGLYQAFRLLGYVGQGQTRSSDAIQALERIKYCALAIIVFIVGGEAYIILGVDDDRAGPVALGFLTTFACIVTATAATVLERDLQGAADLKSEHDLMV